MTASIIISGKNSDLFICLVSFKSKRMITNES
jgi:hypothetical protein